MNHHSTKYYSTHAVLEASYRIGWHVREDDAAYALTFYRGKRCVVVRWGDAEKWRMIARHRG